ncbi:MAG: DNA replication and repair protein RecF [Tannerella sp.]|jgi:DNA replication and repair protein RecF|nr:DNA replication and repair protein RecF [Tannerella sp.]
MIINELSILNYKNIRQTEVICSVKTNCFFGNNGMGKTNLLDAIYYLSFCKSHVHTPDSRLIRKGEDFCILQGIYDYNGKEEDIFCSVRRNQRKQFKRNKKEYERLSEHIGLLPLVVISPTDSDLIRGGSDERRRFIDMIISQHDKSYLNALIQYNKAVMQRNVLLREQRNDASLYDVFEMQMATYGLQIYEQRNMFVQTLIPVFNEYHHLICDAGETVGLSYVSQLAAGDFIHMLKDSRAKDRILGYSSVGVHKDDMTMTLDEQLMRHTGSQGQNKTFLIALKLAQFSYMSSKVVTKPILLLDDIFDKLDAERVEKITGLVSGDRFGQIFITDTNRKYLDHILEAIGQDYSLFKVEHGDVRLMENKTNQ